MGSGISNLLGDVGSGISSGVNWLGKEASGALSGIENFFGGGKGGSGGALSTALTKSVSPDSAGLSAAAAPTSPIGASGFSAPTTGGSGGDASWFSPSDVSGVGSNWTDSFSLGGGLNPDGTISNMPFTGQPLAPVGGGDASTLPSLVPSSSAGGGLSGMLKKDWLPALLMGYSVYNGNKTPAEVKQLQALAAQQGFSGQANEAGAQAALTGQLPGSAEILVEQGLKAKQAAIRQNYAQLGMSGSSAEAQDLAYAAQAAEAERFQIGQGMAQTGFQAAGQELGMEQSLLEAILQEQTARGTALGDSLAKFAGAMVDYGHDV